MAANHLRTIRYIPTPGTNRITHPAMVFARPVKVVRNNINHFIHLITGSTGVAVNNDVLFSTNRGLYIFDPAIPFGAGEEVFVIFKVPLI